MRQNLIEQDMLFKIEMNENLNEINNNIDKNKIYSKFKSHVVNEKLMPEITKTVLVLIFDLLMLLFRQFFFVWLLVAWQAQSIAT